MEVLPWGVEGLGATGGSWHTAVIFKVASLVCGTQQAGPGDIVDDRNGMGQGKGSGVLLIERLGGRGAAEHPAAGRVAPPGERGAPMSGVPGESRLALRSPTVPHWACGDQKPVVSIIISP